MIGFQELLTKLRGEIWTVPERVLAIDPGETSGIALFENGKLLSVDQIDGTEYDGDFNREMSQQLSLTSLFIRACPTHVVVEDYKVYAHKTKEHTWSSLHTPKLIGAISLLCGQRGLQPIMQMASCKQFVTNDKLKAWDMYTTGQQHARDAIRHGCYFLLFNKDIAFKEE